MMREGEIILAGDVGGTNTRLGLFRCSGEGLDIVAEATFPSRGQVGLKEIVRKFHKAHSELVRAACFGVAGPIFRGRCEATNLPWVVDEGYLVRELEIERVRIINDLEAAAWAVFRLPPEDFMTLNPGEPGAAGNAAVIAAGTGLGEAGLYWDGGTHRPFACEGGHCNFAPADELQAELWSYLRKSHDHISWERVVSGPGLLSIYRFLRDTGRGTEPGWLREEMLQDDMAEVISRAALRNKSDLCSQTLDLFVRLYGCEAGNLALKLMATGGIYIGGGIAPKIADRLRRGEFMRFFKAKGRFESFMEKIPVRLILNDKAALWGAAWRAADSLRVSDSVENVGQEA